MLGVSCIFLRVDYQVCVFQGGLTSRQTSTRLGGQIVHNADKLDVIGAIGIGPDAYTHKGRPIYDPSQASGQRDTLKAHNNSNNPAIGHFMKSYFVERPQVYRNSKAIAKHRLRVIE